MIVTLRHQRVKRTYKSATDRHAACQYREIFFSLSTTLLDIIVSVSLTKLQ